MYLVENTDGEKAGISWSIDEIPAFHLIRGYDMAQIIIFVVQIDCTRHS